ncbi:MAG: hypothetical protein IAX21_06620 [Candidatus Bathyarchaeota archaeon]|nr:MAG: hypothetical protein IAX21_06620 [Candidatus Bathyarchaeota archaeon]
MKAANMVIIVFFLMILVLSDVFLLFNSPVVYALGKKSTFSNQTTFKTINAFKPLWMQNGVYVEYAIKDPTVFFMNSTIQNFESGIVATWKWECVALEANVATLNVSLHVDSERGFTISDDFLVNVRTREVFFMNGTAIGATFLWAPANVIDGEELVLWDALTEKVTANVRTSMTTKTLQGYQQMFILMIDGRMCGINLVIARMYDHNTGILIGGALEDEAILVAMNIRRVSGSFSMIATNIDLGPRELLPEMLSHIPFVAVVVGIGMVVFFAHLKRRRKSH